MPASPATGSPPTGMVRPPKPCSTIRDETPRPWRWRGRAVHQHRHEHDADPNGDPMTVPRLAQQSAATTKKAKLGAHGRPRAGSGG